MKDLENFVFELLSGSGNAADRLLQYLCSLQQTYSHIPEAAVSQLARQLSIPAAQIFAVIDFYTFLHRKARGHFDVYFSNNITDRMLGSQALLNSLCEQLNVEPGVPRADGRVSVDTTSCTGICDQGPAMLINGRVISRLDQDRINSIAKLIEADTPLDHWPEEFFIVADNIQQHGLLLSDEMRAGNAIEDLLDKGAEAVLDAIEQSGLRGRGGAGFNTANKWRMCRTTDADQHYVVCNADEGEPGTFKDRVLLNSYADALFEGMTVCAGVISAQKGYLCQRN